MDYVLLVLFYYLCVFCLLAPWMLMLLGAWRRNRRWPHRLNRFQLEGSLLIVISMLLRLAAYDAHFGLDRLQITRWGYWFSRGENGLFLIGLLLLGVGFFLVRRPRPGLHPWPKAGKTLSISAILSGVALGIIAYFLHQYPWFSLPWPWARVLFTLGMYPFAILYWLLAKSAPEPEIAFE